MEGSSHISIKLGRLLRDRTRYPFFGKPTRREYIIVIVRLSRSRVLIIIPENTEDFESVLRISSKSKSPNYFVLIMPRTEA